MGKIDREAEARSALLEHMSEYDDHLLEDLIEDHEPAKGALFEIARRETQESVILPCFMGAASHMNGVTRLMKALRHEAPKVDALRDRLGAGQAVAVGFHAQNRKHLGKCTFLRALTSGVAQGAMLGGGGVGGLSELGGKSGHDKLEPGDVAIAVKSDQLNAGTVLTGSAVLAAPAWAQSAPPAMARLLKPVHERDDVRLSAGLAKLAETDPCLKYRVFSGCAGWSPDQLESEVSRGDWYLRPACQEIVYHEDPYGIYEVMLQQVHQAHRLWPHTCNDPRWN